MEVVSLSVVRDGGWSGCHVHYIMISKLLQKLHLLAIQLCAQVDWLGVISHEPWRKHVDPIIEIVLPNQVFLFCFHVHTKNIALDDDTVLNSIKFEEKIEGKCLSGVQQATLLAIWWVRRLAYLKDLADK